MFILQQVRFVMGLIVTAALFAATFK